MNEQSTCEVIVDMKNIQRSIIIDGKKYKLDSVHSSGRDAHTQSAFLRNQPDTDAFVKVIRQNHTLTVWAVYYHHFYLITRLQSRRVRSGAALKAQQKKLAKK